MRTCLVFLICLTLGTPLSAQIAKRSYHVPNNSDITQTISVKDRYLLENFRKGTVYLRNGGRSEAPLNYSYFHAEIQFIDKNQDTLVIAENEMVRHIVIDDMVFYYLPQQGHIQLIGDFGKIKLGRSQKLIKAGTEHRGAYGGYSSTASIASYSTYVDSKGYTQKLHSSSNVILRMLTAYYWIDQNQRFYPANKANLNKIFSKQKEEIKSYLNNNTIDFADERDLTKLLEYCKSF